MPAYVCVRNLVKRYGHMVAVAGISFDIARGEIFGLLGPNAAGKTTTVEIMEGLRSCDEGEVTIGGVNVHQSHDVIKQIIGVQLQSTAFYRKITVLETIRQFAGYYRNPVRTEGLLDLVALTEQRHKRIEALSGGQRQRLALALALVNNPEIIFLDEPTAGLDPQSRRQLWHVIGQMKEDGKTVVLTTHYIEEAEKLCDRIAIIDRGKVVALDSPMHLSDKSNGHIKLRFATAQPLDVGKLQAFSTTGAVEVREGEYVLPVADSGQSIIALIQFIQAQGTALTNLRVQRATLEDVFIDLTGRRIRE